MPGGTSVIPPPMGFISSLRSVSGARYEPWRECVVGWREGHYLCARAKATCRQMDNGILTRRGQLRVYALRFWRYA
ncbi:hypothetical protein GCM10022251_14420 [Phytohabitans flavus]|uniref:Uncharacterized protein n=1 Tax=Phytohabitans flavus TaxID=1076124 RepID=A0A6F8Y770_9ACTN|nr:hypothetical protein Pflav_082380 [Phytohabitans flavus]